MARFRHRIGSAGMVLAALVALGSGAAQAAPQVLALIATNGKVDLVCEGGACSAELTSFCLDIGRFSPAPGTAYHLAEAAGVRLLGTTADGRSMSLDPRKFLSFESARSHVAVRVFAARSALEARGLHRVGVSIGANVALLPAPEPGDPNPITESEAALSTGPLRTLGSRIVEGNGERVQAARVANRMINLLPPGGASGEFGGEALWRRATQAKGADDLSPEARKRARGAFELCRFVVNIGGSSSLRRCLQKQHDRFIDFLNSEYWDAVKTGS
jgi:hypothetical protein